MEALIYRMYFAANSLSMHPLVTGIPDTFSTEKYFADQPEDEKEYKYRDDHMRPAELTWIHYAVVVHRRSIVECRVERCVVVPHGCAPVKAVVAETAVVVGRYVAAAIVVAAGAHWSAVCVARPDARGSADAGVAKAAASGE